jgi:hypothetical protein
MKKLTTVVNSNFAYRVQQMGETAKTSSGNIIPNFGYVQIMASY